MTRSFGVSPGARMLPVFLALVGMFFLLADPVAAESGVEDNPPEISGGAVSPNTLPYEGGNVQLSADVVDDFGVAMVFAVVYGPDGQAQAIQLFQGDRSTYFGTLEVMPNHSEFPVSYGVEIQAYDTNNTFVSTSIGEVQVEAAPQFDEFPYVSEATVTPQFLPATGGTVTISAEAGDNRSISTVFATISSLAGSTEVPLAPISFSRYEGTFAVPANSGPLATEYVVEVVAQDDIGQESRATAGIVTVEPPPPTPSSGQLQIQPAPRSFGAVPLGKTARRLVFVRNTTRHGGAPVEATARIVGSPGFSLAGASPEGIHFSLSPGEKLALPLEFRPTISGEHSATLQIVRDDGGQPGLAVGISGRGVDRSSGGSG